MKERKIRSRAHILAGSRDKEFAAKVASELGLAVEKAEITHFANTELKAEVPTVRGDHVFVIGSHGAPVNEAIMEQIALINAANNASARDITAVVPYRGYGRADRPDNSHESYMGPLVMRMLEAAGANRILEVDPHSGQSAGFLRDVRDEYTPIPSYPAIQEYIANNFISEGDNVCIVSPDSGRAKLNRRYAEYFNRPRAIVDKIRSGTNKAEVMTVIGEVAGMHCIIIDDMIDTGGTIVEGAGALKKLGAKSVTIIATHGILSGPAIERLSTAKRDSVIGTIAVTDTLHLPENTPEGLIDVISVAPLVATAIRNIFQEKSVSGGYQ